MIEETGRIRTRRLSRALGIHKAVFELTATLSVQMMFKFSLHINAKASALQPIAAGRFCSSAQETWKLPRKKKVGIESCAILYHLFILEELAGKKYSTTGQVQTPRRLQTILI